MLRHGAATVAGTGAAMVAHGRDIEGRVIQSVRSSIDDREAESASSTTDESDYEAERLHDGASGPAHSDRQYRPDATAAMTDTCYRPEPFSRAAAIHDEYARIHFLVERDGLSATREWVERTLANYREAVDSPGSHASTPNYRPLFEASIETFEQWLADEASQFETNE